MPHHRFRRLFGCLSMTVALGGLEFPAASGQQPAADELKSMRAAEGFEVSLFASEPFITNPAAIDVDSHGRVWVAEIQWYRANAKNPPADKIKVLEDTNGDGQADKVTVFADGLFCPMSVCVAGDEVLVATSPDLWVFTDKDGDLKADGPPRKVLTGFGGINHDHGAHSLVLGPDHKWWMAHGDAGFDVTGTDGSHVKYQWGAMLRGELDGSMLEIVAENFRNPYEICVSSFGEAYCSDNDNDGNQSTRICWIMPGGNFGWYGRPPHRPVEQIPFAEHWHFRGHVPGHVPGTLVTGFGSPCGMCFYEGFAFGEKSHNSAFHADPGPREVRRYTHALSGAGRVGRSDVILTADDPRFRPVDVCVMPDGCLLVADWYDGGVGGHHYDNPDQGRIFLLRPRGEQPKRREKPGPYATVGEAIEGLKSPNLATQYLARQTLIAEGESSVAALEQLLSDNDANVRARALWVLDRIGGDDAAIVVAQLQSEEPQFRALAVRILGQHEDQFVRDILPLANDPSVDVQREVLLALQHARGDEVTSAIAAIAGRYDGADRYLLEAINITAAGRKSELYDRITEKQDLAIDQIRLMHLLHPDAAMSQLKAELGRRDSSDSATRDLLSFAATVSSPEAGRLVLDFIAKENSAPEFREYALAILTANLQDDWAMLAEDARLETVLRELLQDDALAHPALQVIGNRQMDHLAGDVLALIKSTTSPDDVRCLAIDTIVGLRADEGAAALREQLESPSTTVRKAALTALVDLNDVETLRTLLGDEEKNFEEEIRASMVERTLATTSGALMLRKLLADGAIDEELKPHVVNAAVRHPDAYVRTLYEELIPAGERPERLQDSISAEQILALVGDATRGMEVFLRSSASQCKNCHRVQGFGGQLGPDLSMIGKKYGREALLETILQPSKAIADEFRIHVAQTTDGQVLAGIVDEKNDEKLVLKDAQNERHMIPLEEIESLTTSAQSAMPELVLGDISPQDAADLLEYLTTLR